MNVGFGSVQRKTCQILLKYVLLTWYSLGEVKAVLSKIYAVQIAMVSLICQSSVPYDPYFKDFWKGTKKDVGFSVSIAVGNVQRLCINVRKTDLPVFWGFSIGKEDR